MHPFIPRLISLASLAAPMFAVTLQRNAINRGGSLRLLSIGELLAPVESGSLTWVPVRGYASEEGGISVSPDSQANPYAIAWEVFIDAAYFDGRRLPDSQLADPTTQNSALIDTVSPFRLVLVSLLTPSMLILLFVDLPMLSTPSIPTLEEPSLFVRRHTTLRSKLVARCSLLIPAISSGRRMRKLVVNGGREGQIEALGDGCVGPSILNTGRPKRFVSALTRT
ncbi:hypothetical protein BDZ89DRAFT_1255167 [Hymenopellis radicata]|nr:hypothetical protein BDZ89DRAFT_1255167 [Hymenopellis radicata]